MTNLIRQKLPSTVEVGGNLYQVNPSFDCVLKVLALLNDSLFPVETRIKRSLEMFYIDKVELNQSFVDAMLDFISDGEKGGKGKGTIDFEKDCNFIFSHFYRLYGIDLSEDKIHWYKFKALIADLGKDTFLQTKVDLLSTKVSDVPKKNQARLIQLQNRLRKDNYE